MKYFSVFILGLIIGAVALASTHLLGSALESRFWLGARNGFLIGAGFVLTTFLLTTVIRVADTGSRALRNSRR